MGTTESKEEVIIAQAGNSGGASNGTNFGSFNVAEILGITAFIGILLLVIAYCCRIYKKKLTKKIRRELSKSTEQI